ncbi:MAG: DNA-3-methyladenine glycosylase [Deltaproteobacteria bacterium]|nr:DNA-3-methyladenine glycosylase [Deltaproteobacteria bacterium]
MQQRLLNIFDILLKTFGKRHWWPGETPLEIIVGAVLTQNTSWKNVEKAIANLKDAGLMDIDRLHEAPDGTVAEKIRSSGYYNLKTARLRNVINVIHEEYSASIEKLKRSELFILRDRLLAIKGIGEETADSILLYALEKPIFVIDAYTKRFLANHGLHEGRCTYGEAQELFMSNLPSDEYLYNEYHALIVALGQNYCFKVPKCEGCPLKGA